jgi:hypothetical protein
MGKLLLALLALVGNLHAAPFDMQDMGIRVREAWLSRHKFDLEKEKAKIAAELVTNRGKAYRGTRLEWIHEDGIVAKSPVGQLAGERAEALAALEAAVVKTGRKHDEFEAVSKIKDFSAETYVSPEVKKAIEAAKLEAAIAQKQEDVLTARLYVIELFLLHTRHAEIVDYKFVVKAERGVDFTGWDQPRGGPERY